MIKFISFKKKYIYWVGGVACGCQKRTCGSQLILSVWALEDGLNPSGLVESDFQYLLSLFKFF